MLKTRMRTRKRKPAGPKRKHPRLGEWQSCKGQGLDVYTLRGWVHVDGREELDEELRELESLYKKGEPYA